MIFYFFFILIFLIILVDFLCALRIRFIVSCSGSRSSQMKWIWVDPDTDPRVDPDVVASQFELVSAQVLSGSGSTTLF